MQGREPGTCGRFSLSSADLGQARDRSGRRGRAKAGIECGQISGGQGSWQQQEVQRDLITRYGPRVPGIQMMILQNARNFRDLGGYRAEGGRIVRHQLLFRSDHLGALTPRELAEVLPSRVLRVCDLRGVTERCAAPCAIEGLTVHSLPIEPTIVQVL